MGTGLPVRTEQEWAECAQLPACVRIGKEGLLWSWDDGGTSSRQARAARCGISLQVKIWHMDVGVREVYPHETGWDPASSSGKECCFQVLAFLAWEPAVPSSSVKDCIVAKSVCSQTSNRSVATRAEGLASSLYQQQDWILNLVVFEKEGLVYCQSELGFFGQFWLFAF